VQANTLITKILELAREDPKHLEELERFRRAITVMFTDIKGSTEYFERFGDVAGLAMVHECNAMLRQKVESHGGRVIKMIGDAVMAVFEDNDQSVRAAIAMQRRLQKENGSRKHDGQILVRIGLHHGMGIVKSDDVFGDVVNVASRVESIAQPEQIVISEPLQRAISPGEFDVGLLGRFHLKGKTEEWNLYEVLWSEKQQLPALMTANVKISGFTPVGITVQQLGQDGTVKREYQLTPDGLTVGSADSGARPQRTAAQARFSVLDNQVVIEDVANSGRVFIRLVAPYTLENGMVIMMGRNMFKFVCKWNVVEAATKIGKTLSTVNELLHEPAAQLVEVTPDGSERSSKYPLWEDETTFGRAGATYSFREDNLMSRAHARIYHRGEDFFLEDLSSLNGTWVMVRDKKPVPIGASVLVEGQLYRVAQQLP
jgi:class 3 adenylate cyclase